MCPHLPSCSLRGYLNAPDSNRAPGMTRYLTMPQLPTSAADLLVAARDATPAERVAYLEETTGNDYMKEYRAMWKDV